LIRSKEQGWRELGGILLAFTGVKALLPTWALSAGELFS
jgi:hypothetical protein